MTEGAPAPIREHPQYAAIVDIARNGPMLRQMRVVLVALALGTFGGLIIFVPGMPLPAALAFGGFFLLPLLFSNPRPHAQRAVRALERAEAAPAVLEFEEYDSEDGARFTLRNGKGDAWHVRMALSNIELNALARQRDHEVTFYPDPETGAPAAILICGLLLWQFEAKRS